jgi:hypothetical protein
MRYMSDIATKDSSCLEFATKDPDSAAIQRDISHSISAIIDINNISQSPDIDILNQIELLRRSLETNTTIKVVTSNTLLSDYIDPTYFTYVFSTVFSYETRKHLDRRRTKAISLST